MDKIEVFKTLNTFCPEGSLIEVRAIHATNPKNNIWSGYFKSHEDVWNAIQPFDKEYNLYFVLNVINDVCYSMIQKDKMVRGAETTKDHDIISRRYVLIDLDCERGGKKVSSTEEEYQMARKKAHQVRNYLRDEGFSFPVVACSGSGFHLIYKIDDWANTDENKNLLEKFLQALSLMFSDEYVKVDTVVWNSSRIDKLYGTVARKGANTPERPHRLSKIVLIPDEYLPTDKAYFQKIASIIPEEEPIKNYETIRTYENFNIDDFLVKHNIGVAKDTMDGNIRKIVLEECCFNPEHKAPDSALFVLPSGAIGFKCLHQSCSHYTFKDFRLRYEPDAYDKKDYKEFQHKQRYYGSQYAPKSFVPEQENEEKGKKWLSMKDIKRQRESDLVAIPTGFTALDKAVKGFILGECTILSGINGSGKSSWLDIVMLNAIQRGFKVACWSGELTDRNIKRWIMQSAAGKNHLIKNPHFENSYDIDDRVYGKIEDWLDGKFFLYNNNYGSRFSQLLADVEEIVNTENTQLVIIDNCMAVDLDDRSGDRNEKQKQFILELVSLAKRKSIHIAVVAHPRKEANNSLLRKESISGSGDLTNAVQSCMIIHRVGEDFIRRATDFWGAQKVEQYKQYDNVIEVCKSRSTGVIDLLVGMYYEPESRRFKNEVAEHIVYGWQEEPTQQTFGDDFSSIPTEFEGYAPQSDDFDPFGSEDDSPF